MNRTSVRRVSAFETSGFKTQDTDAQADQQQSDKDKDPVVETPASVLKEILFWYLSSATIHGVTHTHGPNTYAWRRVIWLFLVLAMTIGLSVVVYNELSYLAGRPIKTTVTATMHESIPFPAVTICNLNQYHRDRVPDNLLINTTLFYLSEYAGIADPNSLWLQELDLDNMTDVSGEEMYEVTQNAAYTVDEMFVRCEWKMKILPCKDLFTRRQTLYGPCFTFNYNQSNLLMASSSGILAGLKVMVNINYFSHYYSGVLMSGVKVLVHEPDEIPFPVTDGFTISAGMAASISINRKETTRLAYPYKAFGSEYCLDTSSDSYKNSLARFPTYSFHGCLMENVFDYIADNCGCRHFHNPGNESYCSAKQLLTCYRAIIDDLTYDGIYASSQCQKPCKDITYEPVLTYADGASDFIIEQIVKDGILKDINFFKKSIIQLKIHIGSLTVVDVHQEPEKTMGTIIGSLGGQLGIFLGASILSITELLEMLGLIFLKCCNVWLCRKGRPNQASSQAVE